MATEHFYVAVRISEGYRGSTLSAQDVEDAIRTKALAENIPVEDILVHRWGRHRP